MFSRLQFCFAFDPTHDSLDLYTHSLYTIQLRYPSNFYLCTILIQQYNAQCYA